MVFGANLLRCVISERANPIHLINDRQQRFSYDAIGRLSTAGEYRGDTSALTYQANYSYDRWGNRYQKQSENSQSLSYIPVEDSDITKSTNKLASNTTYDDAGNVTADSKFRGLQYRYDANGRMWWSANLDNTGEGTSVYDALGQRVQTTAGSNTKTHVYDVFGRMVAEYDSQTQSGTGGVKYLMSDLQGSARVATDGSGAVVARHDYQPFGGEIGAGTGLRTTAQKYDVSDSTRQKYALTERDATGLDHTNWRKYDNSAGRWTSPDPLEGDQGDPQSFNRYSYVQNDPVNSFDPSGLKPCEPGNYSAECGIGGFGGWGWGNLIDRPHLAGRRDIAEDERLNPYLETATPQGMIGIPFFLPEYFGLGPQKPTKDCWTIRKLLNDPKVREAFEQAWRDTQKSGKENGGWIFMNMNDFSLSVFRATEGTADKMLNFQRDFDALQANLRQTTNQNPTTALIYILDFHTHPGGEEYNTPSGLDLDSLMNGRPTGARGVVIYGSGKYTPYYSGVGVNNGVISETQNTHLWDRCLPDNY